MSLTKYNDRCLPKFALVDADVFVYSIGFASEEDSAKYAKARLTETLDDLLYIHLKVDDYQAYITGSTNFRNDIAKTVPYKGNRKDMKKPKHYEALREHLIVRHDATVSVDQEADDDVSIEATKRGDDCLIVHVDKDLRQIPGWHHNPHKAQTEYIDDFNGYKAFCTQLLTGDRVDAIPGLEGIGPVKAEKALKGAKTKEDLLQAVWKVYQEKGHGIEYLTEQGQLLWLRRYEGELWQPSNVS